MSPAPPCPLCQSTHLSIRRKVVVLPDPLPLDGWLAVGIPPEDILGIRCQQCQYSWSLAQPSPEPDKSRRWQDERYQATKRDNQSEIERLPDNFALVAGSVPWPAAQRPALIPASFILVMLAIAAMLGWIISVAWRA